MRVLHPYFLQGQKAAFFFMGEGHHKNLKFLLYQLTATGVTIPERNMGIIKKTLFGAPCGAVG